MRRALRALLALGTLCCAEDPGPAPYAFARLREQRFRVEAEEKLDVDGSPVLVQHLADLRLVATDAGVRANEIEIYLERYYQRVEGAPGGTSELTVSEEGLAARGGKHGDFKLGPDEMSPNGGPVRDMLRSPLGTLELDAHGGLQYTPWESIDPVLIGISVADWLLLGLPYLREGESWSGSRPLPRLGQYRLGIELPLQYRRLPAAAEDGEGAQRIHGRGDLRRPHIALAKGFEGALELDARTGARLDADGRLRQVDIELDMRFDASGDEREHIESRYLVRIRCRACGETETL